MANKPAVIQLKQLLKLPDYQGVLDSEGRVLPPKSPIFERLSNAIDNRSCFNAKNVYTILKMDRYSVYTELLSTLQITTSKNDASMVNSTVDSIDENPLEFRLDVADVWDKMRPDEVEYRFKNREKRRLHTLRRYAWTHALYDKIFEETKIPCALTFKTIKMSASGYFASIWGSCPECPARFEGRIIHPPEEDSPIIMECGVTDFDPSIKHTKNRQLKGNSRDDVAKKLVEGNVLPCSCRRQEADRLMKFGDDEPSHLFSSHVLRKAKQERQDNILGITTNNVFESLQLMKYSTRYEGAIKSIGLDPLSVHYWTREQTAVYEQFPYTLYIDATGSLMKKVKLPNGETCSHIYLYQAVAQVDKNTAPVFQMVSSVQNTNAIACWLFEFLRFGSLQKSSFPIPKEVVTDFDKALLGATARAFAQQPSLRDYLSVCFNLIRGVSSFAPPCLLRLDIWHFMNMVARWKCFSGKASGVRPFYLRSVAMLRKQTTFEEFENLAKAILTVALGESQSKGSMVDTARSTLTSMIRGCDFSEISEQHLIEPIGETIVLEEHELQATSLQTWAENLYKNCVKMLGNESESEDINGYYCMEFAKKLKTLLPYFPLYSEIMPGVIGYGSVNATSAAVESEFNDLKHRTLRNVGRPLRVDKFISRHITSLSGRLKLSIAGKVSLDFDPCLGDQVCVQKDLIVKNDQPDDPDTFETFMQEKSVSNASVQKDLIVKDDRPDDLDTFDTFIPQTSVSNESVQQDLIVNDDRPDDSDTIETSVLDELKEEQNWRNKNSKRPKLAYSDPCPQFDSSNVKYTALSVLPNGHWCPSVRDKEFTIILSNTCGFDSLCQILAMALHTSRVYRSACAQALSPIYDCVNTLISDGLCQKMYKQRANILSSTQELRPVTRRKIIKVNAKSNIRNLTTYLLEQDPSCAVVVTCSHCGRVNKRTHVTLDVNFDILTDKGVSELAEALSQGSHPPKKCCGEIPTTRKIYGPHLLIETDSGTGKKEALKNFPENLRVTDERCYNLAGIIEYCGNRRFTSIGHYTAYVKVGNHWLYYDEDFRKPKSRAVTDETLVDASLGVYILAESVNNSSGN